MSSFQRMTQQHHHSGDRVTLETKQKSKSFKGKPAVPDSSVYSNIARFASEINYIDNEQPLSYQQSALQKALNDRKPAANFDNRFKYDSKTKGVNDYSTTLFLEQTEQIGLNSRREEWHDKSLKQPRPRRIEMENMTQNQILERIKHDKYFVRRQMAVQKFQEGKTWNNEPEKPCPAFSRGPVDPFVKMTYK